MLNKMSISLFTLLNYIFTFAGVAVAYALAYTFFQSGDTFTACCVASTATVIAIICLYINFNYFKAEWKGTENVS